MDITVSIPDDLASRFGTATEIERRALEALAIEAFKLGHLSLAELRRLLGFETRDALDGFLKAHGVFESFGLEDLERDREGFAVTGTLGILDLAARRGMIELGPAFSLLKATNFRYRPELLDRLLLEHRKSSGAV